MRAENVPLEETREVAKASRRGTRCLCTWPAHWSHQLPGKTLPTHLHPRTHCCGSCGREGAIGVIPSSPPPRGTVGIWGTPALGFGWQAWQVLPVPWAVLSAFLTFKHLTLRTAWMFGNVALTVQTRRLRQGVAVKWQQPPFSGRAEI